MRTWHRSGSSDYDENAYVCKFLLNSRAMQGISAHKANKKRDMEFSSFLLKVNIGQLLS